MKNVPTFDRIFYLLACLFTLGSVYIIKTIIVNSAYEISRMKNENI